MMTKTALTAIKCYKKFISPFKGFKCAYGFVHGVSCSTVAAELIKEHGIFKAKPLIKQQFVNCRTEYEKLKNQNSNKGIKTDDCGFGVCYPVMPSGRKSDCDVCEIDACDCDIGPC